jgi:hypothetical protein
MHDYLLKLEIISNHEKKEDKQDGGKPYNWMQENHSLLRDIDQSMLITKEHREFDVNELNIGKDSYYFLMSGGNKVKLEHGDIVNLPENKIRISLLRPSIRENKIVNDDMVLNKIIGYQSTELDQVIHKEHAVIEEDRFLKPLKRTLSPKAVEQRRLQAVTGSQHNLVPSQSAFTTPTYGSSSDLVRAKKPVRSMPADKHENVVRQKTTIQSSVSPIDQIESLYQGSQKIQADSFNDLEHETTNHRGIKNILNRFLKKSKEEV